MLKCWLRHKSKMDTHRPGISAGTGTPMVLPDSPPDLDRLFLLRFPLHLHLRDQVRESAEEVHQAVGDGNQCPKCCFRGKRWKEQTIPNSQNFLIILNKQLIYQTDIKIFCKTTIFSICTKPFRDSFLTRLFIS